MHTAFCENLKVASSDFLMIKIIVAPLSLSSLPRKLICRFTSGFSNPFFLLKSNAISL